MIPAATTPTSRRDMLHTSACGFGALALSGLCADEAVAAPKSALAAKQPHHPARAKRIIFIFMQGGPSHVDTFDRKPELIARDQKTYEVVGVREKDFGKVKQERLMKPLWKFRQYGESGRWVSDLFPHIGRHADDLCFLQGMHTNGVAHGPATLFLHNGATNLVVPSAGAWVTYGLGTENQNLPGFITVSPSPTKGGPRNYSNAFLPAAYQGTTIGAAGLPASKASIHHIRNNALSQADQRRQFELLRAVNRAQADRAGTDDALEGVIESYELAYRMQSSVPAVMDLSNETKSTLDMYGINEKATDDFGRQCLLARRFAEAGVRYTQINYGGAGANPLWDQHSNMPKHTEHALATDKPVAGLLADLKARGLLEDTLVWWGGEFGRTPFTQGADGRDHNPLGFTMLLAGGGVKPGFAHGGTDEIGHRAVHGKVHMHDLHATILHLLGLDHTRLTYTLAGRDFRLTGVAGEVIHDIIA